MRLLNCFWPFVHKARTLPRLLLLSCVAVVWFGGAFSVYAESSDGSNVVNEQQSSDDGRFTRKKDKSKSKGAKGSPKMVRLVSVSSSNTDQMTVDWFPAQDDKTLHQDMMYQVHVSLKKKFIPNSSTLRYQGKGVVTAIITNLSVNSRYTVMVTATDEDGNKSWSNRLKTKTVAKRAKRTSKKVRVPKSSKAGKNKNEIILPATEPVPELGEYLISDQGNGYLKKITAVTQQNGQTHVQMEPAALTDIFESVEFSTTIKMEDIPPDTNQNTNLRRRNTGNKHQVTWPKSRLTLSETDTPELRKVPAMRSMATLDNTSIRTRRLEVNGDTQTNMGSYANFSGPAFIGAIPGETLLFKLNLKTTDAGSMVCNIKMIDFDHKDETKLQLSKPELGTFLSSNVEQNGEITVHWDITEAHVHNGGLPYYATFEAYTDGTDDGCEDVWNNNWTELKLKVPIYVTMGELPQNEQKSLSFSGGFDVENTVTIDFKPEIEVGATIEWGKLQEANLIANVNIGFLNQLHIAANGQATLDMTKTLLDSRDFIKIFMVGSVPIVVRGAFGVDLHVEGEAKGEITLDLDKYFGFPEASFGLHYTKSGGWQVVKDFEPKYEFKIDGNGDAGAHIKLTLIPDLTLSFYDAASGRMLVEPYLYGEAGIHGHFRHQIDNDGTLNDLDYWFTNLEVGGGLDLKLYAGLHIFDYNIASYPPDVELDQTDKFKFFSVIDKTPFAKLPALTATYDDTLPSNDSRSILFIGNHENVPNPFYSLFGGDESFFPFDKWTAPKIITNRTGAQMVPLKESPTGRYWFNYTEPGDYDIRLGGHSNLGSFIRQVTNDINLSLPDNDGDGMADHWEQRYSVDDPLDDPDKDGINNLQEFQQGKFPTVSDATSEDNNETSPEEGNVVDTNPDETSDPGSNNTVIANIPVDLNNPSYFPPINPFVQSGDTWYECTRYAFGRTHEKTGIELTFSQNTGRHGGRWYDLVNNPDLEKGSEPRSNSLVMWESGEYGHVAFVEKVDGDTITISEANWASPTDGKYNGLRDFTTESIKQRGDYAIIGYIYLDSGSTIPTIGDNTTPVIDTLPPITLNTDNNQVQIVGENLGTNGTIKLDGESIQATWTDEGINLDIGINRENIEIPSEIQIFDENGDEVANICYPFVDVCPGTWYARPVITLWKKGIINGYGGGWKGHFRPHNPPANRAEFVTATIRAKELGNTPASITTSSFTDVKIDDWYAPYVEYAKDMGIISGCETDKFCPNEPISRPAGVKVVVAAFLNDMLAKFESGEQPTHLLSDVTDPSQWYYPYIYAAQAENVISGYSDGSFKLERDMTRAEMAKVICLAFAKVDKDTKQSDCAEMGNTDRPAVFAVTPNTAILDESIVFTVEGVNLPETTAFWIGECENVTPIIGGTTETRQFECTPSHTAGIKEGVVKDKSGGTELVKFTVNVQEPAAVMPIVVTSVSPTTATLNQLTTFTVNGSNLPDSTAFWVGECESVVSLGGTPEQQQFQCTPSWTTGVKEAVVKNESGGTELFNFVVNVQQAASNDTPTDDIPTNDTPTEPPPDISCTPTVDSVEPTTVTISESVTFTAYGKCLPDTTAFWIGECEGMTALGGSDTEQQFRCTPSWTVGPKDAHIKNKSGGDFLKPPFTVDVEWGTPVVTSVTPSSANLDSPTDFVVKGKSLTDDIAFWIGECENVEVVNRSAEEQIFQCTPSWTTGSKDGVVKDQPGGTELYPFTLEVVN